MATLRGGAKSLRTSRWDDQRARRKSPTSSCSWHLTAPPGYAERSSILMRGTYTGTINSRLHSQSSLIFPAAKNAWYWALVSWIRLENCSGVPTTATMDNLVSVLFISGVTSALPISLASRETIGRGISGGPKTPYHASGTL